MTAAADPTKVYRRAEFWEPETATLLEVVNVLGRWQTASEWAERTQFSVIESAREENMAQAGSVERHDYARRNGLVERLALEQNIASLPFTDERLAASMGKTVAEMDAMAVSKTAASIVFDAAAQSKSSMVPEKAIDSRRAGWMAADGSLDEGKFLVGMTQSRIAVTVGFFLLGKGQLYGYVLAGRIILDATGTFDKIKDVFGPFTEPIFWIATITAVFLAYRNSVEVTKRTANFETYSREDALEMEEGLDKSLTVFDKLAKARGVAPEAPPADPK